MALYKLLSAQTHKHITKNYLTNTLARQDKEWKWTKDNNIWLKISTQTKNHNNQRSWSLTWGTDLVLWYQSLANNPTKFNSLQREVRDHQICNRDGWNTSIANISNKHKLI